MRETWKPAVGYEGLYEVSDFGNIRSLPREERLLNRWGSTTVRPRAGKPVAVFTDKDGYSHVRLSKGGKASTLRLHRIVLRAFTGKLGVEGCHLNHNRGDNSLPNLVWGSRQDNERQKDAAGRRPPNTRQLSSIAEVVYVRQKRFGGWSLAKIANELGRSVCFVQGVLSGKCWREVP